jgi:hypothetical protein
VIIRRQLKRRYVLAFFERLPPCLVGIEACATSHHWSRELKALGHNVRLMPPAYVKPYVKRQKNDAADAEAICEAVTRANMRFVERSPVVAAVGLLACKEKAPILGGTGDTNLLGISLSEDSKAAARWSLASGGEYYGVGAGVGISGFRANLGVADDLFGSREDAYSETVRQKRWIGTWMISAPV